jgi:hypothetical protein
MLENEQMGQIVYARMSNYSAGGMGIDSDYRFARGTPLRITLDNPPFKSAPRNFQALVRWCNEADEEDTPYNFQIGVQFQSRLHPEGDKFRYPRSW